jgi:hypothetical protein
MQICKKPDELKKPLKVCGRCACVLGGAEHPAARTHASKRFG